MTEDKMTPPRERMMEDMRNRGMGDRGVTPSTFNTRIVALHQFFA